MSTITTKDGTEIFYKDWGTRETQPIVFHHGWLWATQRVRADPKTQVRGRRPLLSLRGHYRSSA